MSGLRQRLGGDIEIGIDMQSKIFELFEGKRVANLLDPYCPLFVEEPVRSDNPDNWAEMAEGVNVPLATDILHVKDGFIFPNDKPGWGMDLNYDFIEAHPPIVWSRVNLNSPSAYTMDGAPHIM